MLDFPGDRETIRLRAAVAALHLVRRLVTKS
jgi:nicotinamide mononucleotide (NMN) deamidase PncC